MVQATQTAASKQRQKDPYEKGGEFEEYIKRLFNQRSFDVIKHRKSQLLDGFFDEDHRNPDLEMQLVFSRRKKFTFAVECKWRKAFKNGAITWARQENIFIYQNYQKNFNIPVFVAIGIGGEPSQPEKLFVTPLNQIADKIELYEADLLPFNRRPERKFFYVPDQLRLF